MKKIMFGLAAAIAMVAAADIESSNIVGYQTKNSVAGFNFYSPQFVGVGTGTVAIQGIILGEGASSWEDNLQILDEGGATITTYTYATADESGADSDGWLDGNGNLTDATLAPGQAVIVATANEGTTITSAGEVAEIPSETTSVSGFNFVGNASPVAINIQDVKLGGGATSWEDNLQILDEGGATVVTYTYATADESGLDADGWLDADGNLAEGTLAPGLGFIVATSEAGVKITLPAAK